MAPTGDCGHLCPTFAQPLPTRSKRPQRAKATKATTAPAALRVWRDLIEARARLKADALTARHVEKPARVLSERQRTKPPPPPKVRRAPSRGPSLAEVRLLQLDSGLATVARLVRGWDEF